MPLSLFVDARTADEELPVLTSLLLASLAMSTSTGTAACMLNPSMSAHKGRREARRQCGR